MRPEFEDTRPELEDMRPEPVEGRTTPAALDKLNAHGGNHDHD
jgi:hypothetical protein